MNWAEVFIPIVPIVEAGAALEATRLLLSPVFGGEVPHGDQRPVMVIPGVGGSDAQLSPMRNWLKNIEYTEIPSGIQLNVGNVESKIDTVKENIKRANADHNKRVTLIGHSAGGIFALYFGAEHPDLIEEIVLLGTPLNGDLTKSLPWYSKVIHANDLLSSPVGKVTPDDVQDGIKITCIHARSDQMIHGEEFFYSERVNTIKVNGTHSGMTNNAQVYEVVASVLAKGNGNPRSVTPPNRNPIFAA